jgi:capsular polysaccharide transport system permease protein
MRGASAREKPKAAAVPAEPAKGEEKARAEEAAAPRPIVVSAPSNRSAAEALRKRRARKLGVRFALFVVAPTLLAGAYYGFVASDQFESYAVFTVHSVEMRPAVSLETLVGGISSAGTGRDALAVRDYVLSRDMLSKLDEEHDFIAHYQKAGVDFWSRLAPDSSFENAYEYYRDKLYADYDTTSGSITLRVRAFDAKTAQEVTKAVLEYSEDMVNRLSERERKDRTRYAEMEVEKVEARLGKARQKMLELQQSHSEFSPEASASAAFTVRTELEGELARARAQLMELKAYMREDSPRVLTSEQRVRSLAAQIAGENRRLVDPKNEKGLNTSMADFEAAMVEKEFAEKAFESALASLEIARADAIRQQRYLATIASPSLPDESTYPRRVLAVFTAFVASLLLLGIGSLVVAAVREHAEV